MAWLILLIPGISIIVLVYELLRPRRPLKFPINKVGKYNDSKNFKR